MDGQTRFVLWAGSGQAYAPGAYPMVQIYPSSPQSHWKCLSGFGEAAPAGARAHSCRPHFIPPNFVRRGRKRSSRGRTEACAYYTTRTPN